MSGFLLALLIKFSTSQPFLYDTPTISAAFVILLVSSTALSSLICLARSDVSLPSRNSKANFASIFILSYLLSRDFIIYPLIYFLKSRRLYFAL